MFTKKYVGPVDCASCEKGIVNLNGLRAENVNWNRLPFREPTERIARVSITTAACSLKMTVCVVCSMEPDSVSSWQLQVLRCKNQLSLKKTSTTAINITGATTTSSKQRTTLHILTPPSKHLSHRVKCAVRAKR
jgi:hypothetical protein